MIYISNITIDKNLCTYFYNKFCFYICLFLENNFDLLLLIPFNKKDVL